MHFEAHHGGCAHFDRGDADLAVALGEMAVAGREQRTLVEDRQEQLGALGELLDVEIAAVLARRQGAQAVQPAGAARHRAVWDRRQHEAAGIERPLLALGPFLELRADGAMAEMPMNDAPGMRTPGSSAAVAKPSRIFQCTTNGAVITSRRKPKPGMMALNAVGCGRMSRNSISSMSPGCAPLTKTGPVSGWTAAGIEGGEIGDGRIRADLAVEPSRVSRAMSSPSPTSSNGRDVGMIAVVAALRFGRQSGLLRSMRMACMTDP